MRKITKKKELEKMSPTINYPGNVYWGPSPIAQYPSTRAFPEDLEESDRVALDSMLDRYWKETYPDFEPEIVYGLDKEYYLPALKVLKFKDGEFFSPDRGGYWENMELRAVCKHVDYQLITPPMYIELPDGTIDMAMEVPVPHPQHQAPDDDCDCGIYGSVNIDEVYAYLHPNPYQIHEPGTFVLCVIEPSPDAKVILCRKGWKASKAFISEIVGETISLEEVSQLLSIAWKRQIDTRRIYENR